MTARSWAIKGIVSTNNQRGHWDGAEEKAWVDRLAAFGIEYVTFQFARLQANISSTSLVATTGETQSPTTTEMVNITTYAHGKGLKVCWKIGHDLLSDADHWRGMIGDGCTNTSHASHSGTTVAAFSEGNWTTWFASITAWITGWAALAQANGVEMLILGTEMDSMQTREAQCRALVAAIRAVYSGVLSYCADRQYYRKNGVDQSHWYKANGYPMAWWDAVDYASCSAYWIVGTSVDPTLTDLAAGWATKVTDLEAWVAETGKSIFLSEFGCCSATGANLTPWGYTYDAGLTNWNEQADYYDAMFRALEGKSWFKGVLFWDFSWWKAYGEHDVEFCPLGKLAGEVIRGRWGTVTAGWYGA